VAWCCPSRARSPFAGPSSSTEVPYAYEPRVVVAECPMERRGEGQAVKRVRVEGGNAHNGMVRQPSSIFVCCEPLNPRYVTAQ